jgi:L-lactate dehydrogenase (cytochrome)
MLAAHAAVSQSDLDLAERTSAATLRVLPEVVAAADGRTEVLLDSGTRRGADVVKALCLGARAVLVGRAYAYGLGAGRR